MAELAHLVPGGQAFCRGAAVFSSGLFSTQKSHAPLPRHCDGHAGEGIRGDGGENQEVLFVLRPVLSAYWIAEHGTPPPIDFYELLPLVKNNPSVHQAITDLLKQKETALEGEKVPRVDMLDDFLSAEMERCETIARNAEKRPVTWDAINDFYRKTLDIK